MKAILRLAVTSCGSQFPNYAARSQLLGLFTNRSEVSHRLSRYDDLSDTEIVRMLRDEELLEHHAKVGERNAK